MVVMKVSIRWTRFLVANVDDDNVKKVCERLAECDQGSSSEDCKAS